MTNSIASTKCLPNALSTGNYGMSQSHRYTDDSKEYIIVKLTDSAFRAIEEYQRDDNAKRLQPGQRAKIQFAGNTGVIQFPRPATDANGIPNANGNGSDASGGGGGGGGRKFGFTINNMEGTLECVQQQQQNLGVLGAVTLRMRIHANDDVYDTTRTKMAIAEETEKSKCIREIKPNQSDIGRKVKKPPSAFQASMSSSVSANSNSSNSGLTTTTAFHHHSNSNNSGNNNNSNSSSSNSFNSNNHSRKLGSSPFNGLGVGSSSSSSNVFASRSPNPSTLGASGTVNGSGGRYGGGAASSLASTFANGISQGYNNLSGSSPRDAMPLAATAATASSGVPASSASASAISSRNKMPSGGLTSSNSNSSSSRSANNKSSGGNKMSDVSRRNIRERLIHLLALKAFKKPELFARLKNEGIRDRERNQITNILMDISTMSHNTYNLRRQMWNDVDENWPFFSEQEVQQLKRRKPQNLTPPMSSDAGSSTSGQSPTSTHTGSPPPPSSSNGGPGGVGGGGAGGGGLKRTSLEYDETMFSTVQPKKQRISHYKKDTPPSSTSYSARRRWPEAH